MVEALRFGADLLQAAATRRGRTVAAVVCKLDMGTLRKLAHGLGERDPVGLHDEAEHIAALAAAEAVPHLRRGVHLARRRLLLMERTAAPEIAPPLAQGHALADDGDQIARLADLLYVLVADALCHASSQRRRPRMHAHACGVSSPR